jgi:hypothetical protein
MPRRVVWLNFADVSEELTASFFSVKELIKKAVGIEAPSEPKTSLIRWYLCRRSGVFCEVGIEFLDIIRRVPSSMDVTPCSSLVTVTCCLLTLPFDLKMKALRYSEI